MGPQCHIDVIESLMRHLESLHRSPDMSVNLVLLARLAGPCLTTNLLAYCHAKHTCQ